ncbi:hypothetical protein OUZ56_018299 [Daphnia magna]|uniref:Uncharacterized protein n=1 Tax=Daphnia magna TaxID=35525 RepID=A0ABQ9Z9K2_9CRUS|nr:hypothetical protein OUZ56_018299 [Daphnia magna]
MSIALPTELSIHLKETHPDCIWDNPSHPQVSEAVVVPAALTSLIWQTLGEEDVLDEIVEEGGGSGPSISALPTILSLAGIGLERGEPFWAQIVAAMKGAKESRRRKKLKPTFRTCERMLKRLRKGTSNKSMDVGDEIDFRAPSLDFEMLLKCQVKLGSSIGKEVNDVEKVLYKVHQSMLPVFPVLAFLESGEAWKLISADPWILNVVRHGLELDFEAPPVMVNFPCNAHMDVDQLSIGNEEIGAFRKSFSSQVSVLVWRRHRGRLQSFEASTGSFENFGFQTSNLFG